VEQISSQGEREAAHRRLGDVLSACGSLLVAYSGGVDSVFLAFEALRVLGPARTLAVTGLSPSVAGRQHATARRVAREFGIPWRELATREMEDPRYVANGSERCYHCKSELYGRLADLAPRWGYTTVADGANADDVSDYRPGARAARERGIRSPLQEAGLGKEDIRALSRGAGLPTWDAPASPCLASRLSYGIEVTPTRLRQVEEGERVLRARGEEGDLRVRHHGGTARIEVDPGRLGAWTDPDRCRRIGRELRELGFERVVLDLEGYRRGSLNLAVLAGGASPDEAS